MKFYQKTKNQYVATAKCKVAYQTSHELAIDIANYIGNHADESAGLSCYTFMPINKVIEDIEKYLINNSGELTISINTDNVNCRRNNCDDNVFEFLYQHIAYLQTSDYMIFESCWIHGNSIETSKEYLDSGASSINVEQILNSYFEVT